MDVINRILIGMRTGEYWYMTVADIMFILSLLPYMIVEGHEYETAEEHNRAIYIAGRVVLAGFFLQAGSLILALELPIFLGVIAGVAVLVLMYNIDKLPIWTEDDSE